MDENLKQNAIELNNPEIEIYFQLDNILSIDDDQEIPITLPRINRTTKNEVTTVEVAGNIIALSNYYRQVISIARKYHLDFEQYSIMFWLRLRISKNGQSLFIFSYWDELPHILEFRDWINCNKDMSSFGDGDQGWEFVAQIQNDRVYLYEEDGFHDDDLVSNYFMSQTEISKELSRVCENTLEITRVLSKELGEDLWSSWRGYPGDKFSFGTSDWKP